MTRQLSPGNRCSVLAFSSAVIASLTCQGWLSPVCAVCQAISSSHNASIQVRSPAHLAVPLFAANARAHFGGRRCHLFIATTAHQRCNAETAMPNRTRQRHVKQTQIFRQTFGLREIDTFWRSVKIQNSLKRVAIVIERLILDAEIGNKWQPDQRIFQPF